MWSPYLIIVPHLSSGPKCKPKMRPTSVFSSPSKTWYLEQLILVQTKQMCLPLALWKRLRHFVPGLRFINIFLPPNCCHFWLIEPNNLPNLVQINHFTSAPAALSHYTCQCCCTHRWNLDSEKGQRTLYFALNYLLRLKGIYPALKWLSSAP